MFNPKELSPEKLQEYRLVHEKMFRQISAVLKANTKGTMDLSAGVDAMARISALALMGFIDSRSQSPTTTMEGLKIMDEVSDAMLAAGAKKCLEIARRRCNGGVDSQK